MKFAKREKYFVFLAGCLVAIILLLETIIVPFFENKEHLERGISASEGQLRRLAELSENRVELSKASGDIDKILSNRERGFTLFSFLENIARSVGIAKNITSMKPSDSKGPGDYRESTVEIKLESITIDQLTDYLYRIEAPEELIFIKRISISDNKREEGYLDSIISVFTYK